MNVQLFWLPKNPKVKGRKETSLKEAKWKKDAKVFFPSSSWACVCVGVCVCLPIGQFHSYYFICSMYP